MESSSDVRHFCCICMDACRGLSSTVSHGWPTLRLSSRGPFIDALSHAPDKSVIAPRHEWASAGHWGQVATCFKGTSCRTICCWMQRMKLLRGLGSGKCMGFISASLSFHSRRGLRIMTLALFHWYLALSSHVVLNCCAKVRWSLVL